MSHTQSDESPDDEAVFPFLIVSLDDRGQYNFCKNLLVNLFEPGISPCKADFPDVKSKRQIIENYLKNICDLTQQYGIYTIKLSTPKHQRHINQVQTNIETTSDPPSIDDTGSKELQLNHINCESSDTESDTDNTISVNMITVEKDYEPIKFEQPFTSHIYENQLELLHNYYIEPIDNTKTTQEVNGINTVIKTDKKDETQCSNTKNIYQNIQKEQPGEKIWTIPFLLESPRNKEFQPPDLEIDFLIDSGAESNIINITTWNEINTSKNNTS